MCVYCVFHVLAESGFVCGLLWYVSVVFCPVNEMYVPCVLLSLYCGLCVMSDFLSLVCVLHVVLCLCLDLVVFCVCCEMCGICVIVYYSLCIVYGFE